MVVVRSANMTIRPVLFAERTATICHMAVHSRERAIRWYLYFGKPNRYTTASSQKMPAASAEPLTKLVHQS